MLVGTGIARAVATVATAGIRPLLWLPLAGCLVTCSMPPEVRELTFAPLPRARASKVSGSPGFPSATLSPLPPAAGCAARVARSVSL